MIRFVPEAGSTSRDLAARLARGEPVPEGEWLVADRQTEGHGRSGRIWQDGAGNFMGSTLVRPVLGDPPMFTLALVAGLAVHAAVNGQLAENARPPLFGRAGPAQDLTVTLKWPNDLTVGSAKLAGILLEREGDAVIVGTGVNLLVAPTVDRRQTISLAQLGVRTDRNDFARDLARQFALDLRRWRDFGLAPIVRRWCAAAHPEGTPLTADAPGGTIHGHFAGLSDDGALRLRVEDGSVREIHAGEVRLLDELRS